MSWKKWELESNTIEDELWVKLCSSSHKGIISQQWKEFNWKLKDFSAALCWRQCGKIGDYTHIVWDCPVILHYWKNIKEEIEKYCKKGNPFKSFVFFALCYARGCFQC